MFPDDFHIVVYKGSDSISVGTVLTEKAAFGWECPLLRIGERHQSFLTSVPQRLGRKYHSAGLIFLISGQMCQSLI